MRGAEAAAGAGGVGIVFAISIFSMPCSRSAAPGAAGVTFVIIWHTTPHTHTHPQFRSSPCPAVYPPPRAVRPARTRPASPGPAPPWPYTTPCRPAHSTPGSARGARRQVQISSACPVQSRIPISSFFIGCGNTHPPAVSGASPLEPCKLCNIPFFSPLAKAPPHTHRTPSPCRPRSPSRCGAGRWGGSSNWSQSPGARTSAGTPPWAACPQPPPSPPSPPPRLPARRHHRLHRRRHLPPHRRPPRPPASQ